MDFLLCFFKTFPIQQYNKFLPQACLQSAVFPSHALLNRKPKRIKSTKIGICPSHRNQHSVTELQVFSRIVTCYLNLLFFIGRFQSSYAKAADCFPTGTGTDVLCVAGTWAKRAAAAAACGARRDDNCCTFACSFACNIRSRSRREASRC